MAPGKGKLGKTVQQNNGRTRSLLVDGHPYAIGIDVVRSRK
jgi:hypothetical protein